MNPTCRKYFDHEISVRPALDDGQFAGWPGYAVEVSDWGDQMTERVGWFHTFGQADALRVELRIKL
jgi:hypothetical protein